MFYNLTKHGWRVPTHWQVSSIVLNLSVLTIQKIFLSQKSQLKRIPRCYRPILTMTQFSTSICITLTFNIYISSQHLCNVFPLQWGLQLIYSIVPVSTVALVMSCNNLRSHCIFLKSPSQLTILYIVSQLNSFNSLLNLKNNFLVDPVFFK